ncbi:MAG: FAD-dependent oxidoreductase [Syntrophaceae bacterium]|nr:FAD-dependent oxidoreductase [Syntrophaceae bacterium]
MNAFRLNGLPLALDETEDCLPGKAAAALGLAENDIVALSVLKKALDARRNRQPYFVYAVKIVLSDSASRAQTLPDGMQLQALQEEPQIGFPRTVRPAGYPVVVVGAGPSGLFAAYSLSLAGMPVVLLERGGPVERRISDVEAFWREGRLNPQSNVLFGEGGAGTFSDGKLTSRTKNPCAGRVKRILVDFGAPASILTDAKPHIGTDRLRRILITMRQKLIDLGCAVRFDAQVTDVAIRQNTVEAVVVNNGEQEIKTDCVVVAIGQGADDTYRLLDARGVKMTPKPFALGLRLEHPQRLINRIQYGRWAEDPRLPPAEYFITAALGDSGRSVYSFCMCPGGQVIGSSTAVGTVITNGMSDSGRSGELANSAVVVNVRSEDFAACGYPLGGLVFRRTWEEKAFAAGGGDYRAPAQRLTDFIADKSSPSLGPTSFLPGVRAARLDDILPPFVAGALRAGIRMFDRKMPGFVTAEAHLIGVETRTSSPVRIVRRDNGQSENVQGLYPCGEGAGYAGGIISSALDGIRAARQILTAQDGRR